MKLWVGLGNPGAEYAHQRHNIGFMAADRIAARHRFSPWRKKFRGEAADGVIAGEKILLLKPLTYMNDSGESVQAALAFHKLAPSDVLVFHDELDLAPGKVRVKQGGGAAGHNGLRSTDRHVGNDTWRVRLGIGHPGHKDRVQGHVLGNFAKADKAWLDTLLDAVADAAPLLAEGRHEDFMTRVALLTQPAKGT
jgi:PTH1 family peptidyl-tRNA hydrolase